MVVAGDEGESMTDEVTGEVDGAESTDWAGDGVAPPLTLSLVGLGSGVAGMDDGVGGAMAARVAE